MNNIAYAAAPEMFKWQCCKGKLIVNKNDYWYIGTGSPEWPNGNTVYTTLSAWYAATGWDGNSIYADPLLNSPTYHSIGRPTTQLTLQSGSPGVGAGVNVCAGGCIGNRMGAQDFFGNPLPANGPWNMGAYQ
jgi:hypothetical protein